jgi:type IV secretory pathway VirB4 component
MPATCWRSCGWPFWHTNSIVLARSGAGKSYCIKLEVLRSLADGVHVAVIDPDNESIRLAEAVGGVTFALGVGGVRLNPLDIAAGDRRPDALNPLTSLVANLISLVVVVLVTIDPNASLA